MAKEKKKNKELEPPKCKALVTDERPVMDTDILSIPPIIQNNDNENIVQKRTLKKGVSHALWCMPGQLKFLQDAKEGEDYCIGSAANVHDDEPTMWLDFPTGHLKLTGRLYHPKNTYLALEYNIKRKTDIRCKYNFGKMVVFDQYVWIYKDTTEETKVPDFLYEPKPSNNEIYGKPQDTIPKGFNKGYKGKKGRKENNINDKFTSSSSLRKRKQPTQEDIEGGESEDSDASDIVVEQIEPVKRSLRKRSLNQSFRISGSSEDDIYNDDDDDDNSNSEFEAAEESASDFEL